MGTRGMMEALHKCKDPDRLIVGVDAKVSEGTKAWRTATACLYYKDHLAETTLTKFSNGKVLLIQAFPTSARLIFQARINQESDDTWSFFLRDLVGLLAFLFNETTDQAARRIVILAQDFNVCIETARDTHTHTFG